jgi:preprotein translocase subunit SecG
VDLYLNIAMLIVSIAMVGIILLQSRGGGLGGLGGGNVGGSTYHVRRGIERLLFNITIGLSIVFFVLAVVTVVAVR